MSYVVVIAPKRRAPAGMFLVGWRAEGPFDELEDAERRLRVLQQNLHDLEWAEWQQVRVLRLEQVLVESR